MTESKWTRLTCNGKIYEADDDALRTLAEGCLLSAGRDSAPGPAVTAFDGAWRGKSGRLSRRTPTVTDVPMLFADALAKAIADGRKTVTRRPITKRNSAPLGFWSEAAGGDAGFDQLDWEAHLVASAGEPEPPGASPCTGRCKGRDYCCVFIDGSAVRRGDCYLHVPGVGGETRQRVYCRHKSSDTLVVRECFAVVWGDADPCRCADKHESKTLAYCPKHDTIEYRADTGFAAPGGWHDLPPDERFLNWSPSIHMPRWAVRSFRLVISITPELLGPLSQLEAEREGFDSPEAFATAWSGIYGEGPRWVWRYEFSDKNEVRS